MAAMVAILDIGTNDLSSAESPCRSDASHQVSAQTDLRFVGRCGLKNTKMAAMAATLDIVTERFLQFHYENMPIQIYRNVHLQKLKIFR